MPTSVTSSPPALRHRLAARLRAGSIDRELIAGGDIARSPRLQARAFRLTSRPVRLALAGGLERLTAAERLGPRRMRVRPPHESIRAVAPELSELTVLLRTPTPLYACGLAMLSELLCDGGGPLYARGGAAALERALGDVRMALGGAVPRRAPAAR